MASSLGDNFNLLSPQQQELVKVLLDNGEERLFCDWPAPGVDDNHKKVFFDQVPTGETLAFGDESYIKFDEAGVLEARLRLFLLPVGLGKRLGYSGIKLASVNPIFYDLASDLDTLLVRPEVRIGGKLSTASSVSEVQLAQYVPALERLATMRLLQQSLESDGLRDQLANFAEELNKARQMIYPPDKRSSKLGASLPSLSEVVAKEHKRLLARKSIIEKRKEEQERQLLEMHDQVISGIDWSARSNRIVIASHDYN
ncbi:hypothetical protein JHK86_043431 [Glycine max]|nr:hypothetical protein JHK86_043431 [Glycine max]